MLLLRTRCKVVSFTACRHHVFCRASVQGRRVWCLLLCGAVQCSLLHKFFCSHLALGCVCALLALLLSVLQVCSQLLCRQETAITLQYDLSHV